MVRLKVQEDNVKLKMNAPDGATFRTNEYTPIVSGSSDYNELDNKPSINGHTLEGDMDSEDLGLFSGDYDDLTNKPTEISAANITNGSSSTTGLISGRRAKSAVEAFAPVKDVKIDGTSVVSGGIAQIPKIPELVTDLGVIDGDQYDWDIEAFLNTLQETGSYIFLWDEFKYFVDIKAVEVDGVTTVQQVYWGTEEGGGTVYYRNVVVENGEIIQSHTTNYMTFEEVNTAFARITHNHVRFSTQSQSIWDYCNTVAMQNNTPIVLYFDSSSNKTYLIETYVGNRQPIYKLQRVTEMNDTSCFYQRSSQYYSSAEHWGNWYKFSGTIFDPSGR